MKKLTKQQLLQSQNTASQVSSSLKKKSKTTSTSFTPFNKSATQSEMHIPMQRYSTGTNETPLAMNQNIEYFANAHGVMPSGPGAHINPQTSQRVIMHKPSNSQVVPSLGNMDGVTPHHMGLINAASGGQSTKHSSKVSTLKHGQKRVGIEKVPAELSGANDYSPTQAMSKPASAMHSSIVHTGPASQSVT